jgi:hypothetical protein
MSTSQWSVVVGVKSGRWCKRDVQLHSRTGTDNFDETFPARDRENVAMGLTVKDTSLEMSLTDIIWPTSLATSQRTEVRVSWMNFISSDLLRKGFSLLYDFETEGHLRNI